MKFLLRIVLAIVVVLFMVVIFLYSGIYNISSMVPHSRITLKIITILKDNSIKHYSENITVPNLTTSALINTGFAHYKEMCVNCHGAPGVQPDETGKGLYPKPPDLAKSIKGWTPAQLFWITKNGIKMTGMPAFGKTHNDEKIWAIVAFIEKLPEMTKDQYTTYARSVKEKDED
ncbi:MAG: cytochrome c [Ignavibacteriaceae bacterium]